MTTEEIERWFTYRPPTPEQAVKYAALRRLAHTLALAIVELTPPSADQSAAIRKLRECIMTANAAIACGGD